jgi:DNA replication factor GINS
MYDDLYKAWKSEKSTEALQPIPSDFYQRARKYIETLEQETSSDPRTVQNHLIVREKELAERLLAELTKTRRMKIFQTAQNNIPINTSNLTEEETDLATRMIEPTEPSTQAVRLDEASTIVVRFLQDIPEIVGVDLKIYGPFKKEDVASVPNANAGALISQGAVRVIEFKEQD